MITLNDLKITNKKFWTGFVASCFPTALDEETDMSVSEIIEENNAADINWWENFTKYYDGVLEETDGYIDDPETFICTLTPARILKVEFHPGDTVYYINDKQIGCTGGEYHIQVFSVIDLLNFVKDKNDYRIFLLLLPLTVIKNKDADKITKKISNVLKGIFDNPPIYERIAKSIVYGLTED